MVTMGSPIYKNAGELKLPDNARSNNKFTLDLSAGAEGFRKTGQEWKGCLEKAGCVEQEALSGKLDELFDTQKICAPTHPECGSCVCAAAGYLMQSWGSDEELQVMAEKLHEKFNTSLPTSMMHRAATYVSQRLFRISQRGIKPEDMTAEVIAEAFDATRFEIPESQRPMIAGVVAAIMGKDAPMRGLQTFIRN